MKPVVDENVIGEPVFWDEIAEDESVFGLKVFLNEFFFAIWMKVCLTNTTQNIDPHQNKPQQHKVFRCSGLMTFWKVKKGDNGVGPKNGENSTCCKPGHLSEGGPKTAKIQCGVKQDISKITFFTRQHS